MIKKNDILTLDIIDMGVNGEGIAKHENVVIFVPFALVGEKVKAQIINTKSSFYVAKLVEVVSESPFRVTPPCPVFRKCGGCSLQHLKYEKQLEFKTNLVKNNLKRIGGIETAVLPCIASDVQYAYRNKIQMPVGANGGGFVIGMFANYSHRIVPTNVCLLQDSETNKIIQIVNEFMSENNISGYNEQTGRGVVRHIVARTLNNQILIVLVINGKTVKNIEKLIEKLNKNYENFGLYLNTNLKQTNVILGEEFKHVHGLNSLKNTEYGISYEILPQSFMQVNNFIKTKIYEKVFEIINQNDFDVVIDAYSGAGLLSAMMAKVAKQVIGIEIVQPAVECANLLAKHNNLTNMVNICGDCAVELPKVILKLENKKSCVVLDPPRKGCDKIVLESIKNSNPDFIIYISCNPATLARDLKILTENSQFSINFMQPYDMFPQTPHVETVVCLKKK